MFSKIMAFLRTHQISSVNVLKSSLIGLFKQNSILRNQKQITFLNGWDI